MNDERRKKLEREIKDEKEKAEEAHINARRQWEKLNKTDELLSNTWKKYDIMIEGCDYEIDWCLHYIRINEKQKKLSPNPFEDLSHNGNIKNHKQRKERFSLAKKYIEHLKNRRMGISNQQEQYDISYLFNKIENQLNKLFDEDKSAERLIEKIEKAYDKIIKEKEEKYPPTKDMIEYIANTVGSNPPYTNDDLKELLRKDASYTPPTSTKYTEKYDHITINVSNDTLLRKYNELSTEQKTRIGLDEETVKIYTNMLESIKRIKLLKQAIDDLSGLIPKEEKYQKIREDLKKLKTVLINKERELDNKLETIKNSYLEKIEKEHLDYQQKIEKALSNSTQNVQNEILSYITPRYTESKADLIQELADVLYSIEEENNKDKCARRDEIMKLLNAEEIEEARKRKARRAKEEYERMKRWEESLRRMQNPENYKSIEELKRDLTYEIGWEEVSEIIEHARMEAERLHPAPLEWRERDLDAYPDPEKKEAQNKAFEDILSEDLRWRLKKEREEKEAKERERDKERRALLHQQTIVEDERKAKKEQQEKEKREKYLKEVILDRKTKKLEEEAIAQIGEEKVAKIKDEALKEAIRFFGKQSNGVLDPHSLDNHFYNTFINMYQWALERSIKKEKEVNNMLAENISSETNENKKKLN